MACESYDQPDKYDEFIYKMDNADYCDLKENG